MGDKGQPCGCCPYCGALPGHQNPSTGEVWQHKHSPVRERMADDGSNVDLRIVDSLYEDAEGRLWKWTSTTPWMPETYQWFPICSTGPGIVPSPVPPMKLMYNSRGKRVGL